MKNVIISILAALLTVEKVPWYSTCTTMEKIGIFIGIFIPLIIFCFFCEEMAEKWRKYRKRVQALRGEVTRLRHERREIAGNFKSAGRKPGHASHDVNRPRGAGCDRACG